MHGGTLIALSLHVFAMIGGSLTEEAARNVIKKYKRQRFGEFINRSKPVTYSLEIHLSNMLVMNFISSRKVMEEKVAKIGMCRVEATNPSSRLLPEHIPRAGVMNSLNLICRNFVN